MVTVGLGTDDGSDEFTEIPFRSLSTLAEVGDLDGTVVFVNEPHPVPTRNPAFLDVDVATISVVYPFAEPCFATQTRTDAPAGKTRVLFAGRLSPEKGVYTLLETLHIDIVEQDVGLTFTATTAGADKPQGRIIARLLGEHPGISVVAARRTPAAMAALMADHDIVVMPSNSQYWHETFGIVDHSHLPAGSTPGRGSPSSSP